MEWTRERISGGAATTTSAGSAPAVVGAGAAPALEVEDVHEPRASFSAAAAMVIEMILVFVQATPVARATCLLLRGFLADEGDAFWIENKSFAPDEIAVRFHHGLVKIHPFANGNGRWSRLMGDVLARYLDRPVFTLDGSQLLGDDGVRRAYLASLRKADGDDFPDLLAFARS